MTLLVPMILVGVWVAVLVPPLLRNRSETADSISSFQRHLSILERTSPATGRITGTRRTAAPQPWSPGRARGRKRRRDVLVTLAGGAAFTLLLAVALGGAVWFLSVAAAAVTVVYVSLLVRVRKAEEERRVKVRYLPAQPVEEIPAYALRRAR